MPLTPNRLRRLTGIGIGGVQGEPGGKEGLPSLGRAICRPPERRPSAVVQIRSKRNASRQRALTSVAFTIEEHQPASLRIDNQIESAHVAAVNDTLPWQHFVGFVADQA